jgi:predicted membrane protein
MKKVKIALWILIFGFVGLVILENQVFFKTKTKFILDLWLWNKEAILPNWWVFTAFFLVGVLITYFFSLFKHYKDAKTIKMLKSKEASLVEAVSTLEKQLAQQSATTGTGASDPVAIEPVIEDPAGAVPETK